MSLRALLALLLCAFALLGGAGASEGQALHDDANDECGGECCCDVSPSQDSCCTTPTRGGQGSAAQHSPTTAQAPQLKARRAAARATAASLFYAPFLTATSSDTSTQALARATADPALATPTPALRVTQCRWRL
ncbi:hypothetical protein [Cephaloticoccus capnophilus]|uniref:hypothetical protein n=1 Tax=Cephaloticoccus capnophilus TaxID=1548208 RepID=UPI0012E7339C|nr:hypothetical protein [Cephaloticoccus capnophilus]